MKYKGKTLCSIAPPIDYIPVSVHSVQNGDIVEKKMAIPLDEDTAETYTTIGNDYFFHKHRNDDYDNPAYLLLDEDEKAATQLSEKLVDEYWADGYPRMATKQQPVRNVTVGEEFVLTKNDLGQSPINADVQIENPNIVVGAEYSRRKVGLIYVSGMYCKAGNTPGKTLIHLKFPKIYAVVTNGDTLKQAEETVTVPVIVRAAENQGGE